MGELAVQANQQVESALNRGGITTARYLSNTVTFVTSTSDISIQVNPDILSTDVDKVRVETPDYAITLKLNDLEPDLTETLTFAAEKVDTGYAAGGSLSKAAVKVSLPSGKMTNAITVSLPSGIGDPK